MVREGLSPANLIVNRFDARHIYEANTFTKGIIGLVVPGWCFRINAEANQRAWLLHTGASIFILPINKKSQANYSNKL